MDFTPRFILYVCRGVQVTKNNEGFELGAIENTYSMLLCIRVGGVAVMKRGVFLENSNKNKNYVVMQRSFQMQKVKYFS